MDNVQEVCLTCQFYKPTEKNKGVCRRYPPKILGFENLSDRQISEFPEVDWNDYCGEYRINMKAFKDTKTNK